MFEQKNKKKIKNRFGLLINRFIFAASLEKLID